MEVNFVNALILIGLSILAVIFGVLPITANANVLKLSLLAPMFVLSIVYGLLPNMLQYLVCNVKQSRLKEFSSLVSSLLTCFAGGVILGLCILDLMPTALHDFERVRVIANWPTKYPFVELFIGAGLLLMFLIDELVKRAFKDEIENEIIHSHASTIMRSLTVLSNRSRESAFDDSDREMFQAIRTASIHQRKEMGLNRKRTGTMCTFKAFSPKQRANQASRVFEANNQSVKLHTAHRTVTMPNFAPKKHMDAKKSLSNFIAPNGHKISTPELSLKKQILQQNFQHSKSLSLDSETKVQRKNGFMFEDKELPILEIMGEKQFNDSFKKGSKSQRIKFSITTVKSDDEDRNDDLFQPIESSSPKTGYDLNSTPKKSIMKKPAQKRISTTSTDSSLGNSKSALVKVISSTFKKVSMKSNPDKMRTPTIESIEYEEEIEENNNNNNGKEVDEDDIEKGTLDTRSISNLSDRPEIEPDNQNSCLQALLVISVFFFHAFLEGFSFGIQEESLNIMSLFFGIMVHKSLVMYSAGLNLKARFSNSKIKLVFFISILALITPIGGLVGYLVEVAKFHPVAKYMIMTILHSLSIAMFLFLAIFEIIAEERENKHANLLQWIAYTLGFAVIAAILVAKEFTLQEEEEHFIEH